MLGGIAMKIATARAKARISTNGPTNVTTPCSGLRAGVACASGASWPASWPDAPCAPCAADGSSGPTWYALNNEIAPLITNPASGSTGSSHTSSAIEPVSGCTPPGWAKGSWSITL